MAIFSSISLGALPLLALAVQCTCSYVHMEMNAREVTGESTLRRRQNPYFTANLGAEIAVIDYYINTTVGTPPQFVALTIDTGSSDTWMPSFSSNVCAALPNCTGLGFNPNASSTFTSLGQGDFYEYYAKGETAGDYFQDTFSVGGVSVQNMTLGLGQSVNGGSVPTLAQVGQDAGYFGIGYVALSSAAENYGINYPSYVDLLLSQGTIQRRAYSLWLNGYKYGKGTITFGGIDTTKYSGSLISAAITPNATGSYDRLALDLTSVTFQGSSGSPVLLSPSGMAARSLIDSGYTYLVLPDTVTTNIANGLGLVRVNGYYFSPCSLSTSNATITFQYGGPNGPAIPITVSQFVLPWGGKTFSNGVQACAFLVAPPGTNPTGSFGTYNTGQVLLRAAYAVFDLDNNVIALAPAVQGNPTSSNLVAIPSGTSIPGASSTVTAIATALTSVGPATSTDGAFPSALSFSVLPGTPSFSLATVSTSATLGLTSYSGTAGTATGSATGTGTAPATSTSKSAAHRAQLLSTTYQSIGAVVGVVVGCVVAGAAFVL